MQQEAIRAQIFVNILDYEREINFSEGMDTVRGLRDEEYKNYTEFRKKQPEKDKEIRQVVDFLNHLAHLIRQGYVEPRHILPLYTTSITDCRAKLLGNGKWLDGFLKVAGSETYYLNFQCLCDNLVNLWSRNEIKWPDFWPPSEAMRS